MICTGCEMQGVGNTRKGGEGCVCVCEVMNVHVYRLMENGERLRGLNGPGFNL